MAICRAVVTIPNAFMNDEGPISSATFHFDSGATDITEASGADTAALLIDLFQGIDELYSSGCGAAAFVKFYDLSDPSPRVAVGQGEFVFDAGADTLPGEPAINISFRGARVSGVPTQRHRAAIQLGPLATTCLDEATGRVSGGALAILDTAFTAFAAAADAEWPWVVGSIASGFVPITECKIKNEFGSVGSRQFQVSGTTIVTVP